MLDELLESLKAFMPIMLSVSIGALALTIVILATRPKPAAKVPGTLAALDGPSQAAPNAAGGPGAGNQNTSSRAASSDSQNTGAPINKAGKLRHTAPPMSPPRALANLPEGFTDPSRELLPRDDVTIAFFPIETPQGCAPIIFTYTARKTPIYRMVFEKVLWHRDGGSVTRLTSDNYFKSPAGLKVRRDKRQVVLPDAIRCSDLNIEIGAPVCISNMYTPMTCPDVRLDGTEGFARVAFNADAAAQTPALP